MFDYICFLHVHLMKMDHRNWTYFLLAEQSNITNRVYYFTAFNMLWRTETTRLVLIILDGSVMGLAGLINLFILYLVLTKKMLRTTTNTLVANISIAALIRVVDTIIIIAVVLEEKWIFSNIQCKLESFLGTATVGAYWWTALAIAVDRYRLVFSPSKKQFTLRVALCCNAMIWFITSIQYGYVAELAAVKDTAYKMGTRKICLRENKRAFPLWFQLCVAFSSVGSQPLVAIATILLYRKVVLKLNAMSNFRLRNRTLHPLQKITWISKWVFNLSTKCTRKHFLLIRSMILMVVVSLVLWIPQIYIYMEHVFDYIKEDQAYYRLSPEIIRIGYITTNLNFLISPMLYMSADRKLTKEMRIIFSRGRNRVNALY